MKNFLFVMSVAVSSLAGSASANDAIQSDLDELVLNNQEVLERIADSFEAQIANDPNMLSPRTSIQDIVAAYGDTLDRAEITLVQGDSNTTIQRTFTNQSKAGASSLSELADWVTWANAAPGRVQGKTPSQQCNATSSGTTINTVSTITSPDGSCSTVSDVWQCTAVAQSAGGLLGVIHEILGITVTSYVWINSSHTEGLCPN